MDDILIKHLAKTLLFKENKNDDGSYQYKVLDGKYYISKGSDLIVSEKIGFWKNKEVIKVNNENFVILENTNKLIPLKHISSEEFDKDFTKKLDKPKKSISYQNPLSLPVDKKTIFSKNPNFEGFSETSVKNTPEVSDKTHQLPTNSEKETTEKYINRIKSSENKKFQEDAEESEDNVKFFDLLEKKKDDPRVKKFFNYHADAMKKEFNQIIEKVKTSQFARAMESGGGTNAVQYANGGTMTGNLTVTNQIIAENINDTAGRGLIHKKTFNIVGNGSDKEFTFTHNFNTKDIIISVYDSNYQLIFVSSINIDLNNTKITFPNMLAVGENYRVILIA
jgi:hypothetical protein